MYGEARCHGTGHTSVRGGGHQAGSLEPHDEEQACPPICVRQYIIAMQVRSSLPNWYYSTPSLLKGATCPWLAKPPLMLFSAGYFIFSVAVVVVVHPNVGDACQVSTTAVENNSRCAHSGVRRGLTISRRLLCPRTIEDSKATMLSRPAPERASLRKPLHMIGSRRAHTQTYVLACSCTKN